MNDNHKRIKPKLLDPRIEKKIIKTLTPPKEDYWAPTKNYFRSFYQKYIRKNIWLVIVVIIFILFLIYRYRIIKKKREQQKIDINYGLNQVQPPPSPTTQEEIDLLMQWYNQQKEKLTEPSIKKLYEPKFAYPMYPYAKGGTLVSPGKR